MKKIQKSKSYLRSILDDTQSRNTFGKNGQTIIASWDNECMML